MDSITSSLDWMSGTLAMRARAARKSVISSSPGP